MRNDKAMFYKCSVVIAVLISGIMLIIVHNFSENHQKDQKLTKQFFVSEYNEMETKLSVYLNVCQMIADTEEVKQYAEADGIKNHYEYIKLISSVKQYRGIFPDADGIVALSKIKDNVCITADAKSSLEDYLGKIGIDSEQLTEELKRGERKDDFFVLMLSRNNADDFVTFLYKRKYWSGAEIYFFINVDKNYFCPQQLVKRDTAFFVADAEVKTYVGTWVDWDENTEKVLRALNLQEQQMREERYNRRTIYHKPSLYTANMNYILVDNRSNYGLQLFFLIVLWLALCVSGIVLVKKVLEELQRPMNRFFKLFKGDKADGWDFVMESVQKIIDQNKNLMTEIRRTKDSYRRSFLYELLMGSLTEAEIRSGLADYSLPGEKHDWQCILFEYDEAEQGTVLQIPVDEALLKNDFSETARGYLEDNLHGIFVRIDARHFACLVSEQNIDVLNTHMVRLLNMSDELYGTRIVIAIGKNVENIVHINDSYANAMQLLEQRYWLGEKLIFTSEDLKDADSVFYYPIELEKLLIGVVLDGDKEKCGEILKKLLQMNLQQLKMDRYNMTEFRFALSATVKRIFKQMNKTVEDVFGQDMIIYLELNTAATSKEFEDTVHHIFGRLCECNGVTANQHHINMVSGIVGYIEENYNKDISLSDLAEHCSVSQGHINRLLRENIGISFKEYLDTYRVKKAQELFQTTNLTVNEVSVQVGYNYTKSFISAFKKYAFMTPGEYKNRYNRLQ